jgi:hypothetical protein
MIWKTSRDSTRIPTKDGSLAVRVDSDPHKDPLLLCQRFRGTMDDWDPEFVASALDRAACHSLRQPGNRRDARYGSGNGRDRVGAARCARDRRGRFAGLVAWRLRCADSRVSLASTCASPSHRRVWRRVLMARRRIRVSRRSQANRLQLKKTSASVLHRK